MSTLVYGAVRLVDADPSIAQDLQTYWQNLSALHGVWIHYGYPAQQYLEPDLAALWADSAWVRFQLSARGSETEANALLLEAAHGAGGVLARGVPGVTQENVWCRTPQWRCLAFMFWHEAVLQAYLVVEDASGDVADPSEMRRASLTQALGELWLKYVYEASEDAIVYEIDLAQLPR